MESAAIATWTGRSERDTGNAGNSPAVIGVVCPNISKRDKTGIATGNAPRACQRLTRKSEKTVRNTNRLLLIMTARLSQPETNCAAKSKRFNSVTSWPTSRDRWQFQSIPPLATETATMRKWRQAIIKTTSDSGIATGNVVTAASAATAARQLQRKDARHRGSDRNCEFRSELLGRSSRDSDSGAAIPQ
jgi:hypothetical protein